VDKRRERGNSLPKWRLPSEKKVRLLHGGYGLHVTPSEDGGKVGGLNSCEKLGPEAGRKKDETGRTAWKATTDEYKKRNFPWTWSLKGKRQTGETNAPSTAVKSTLLAGGQSSGTSAKVQRAAHEKGESGQITKQPKKTGRGKRGVSL